MPSPHDPDYWTPEKREEQRQRALALQEQGRWGGSVGGIASGVSRRRASGRLSDRIEDPENVDDMWDALKTGLNKNQPITVRQKTVDRMMDIAERERRIQTEERREIERQSREELIGNLTGALVEALGRRTESVVVRPFEPIIEGTARESTNGSNRKEIEAGSPD